MIVTTAYWATLERLDEETQAFYPDVDVEGLVHAIMVDDYRRSLARIYGFVAPLERSLLDTHALDRLIDLRRFRKHILLEHDLQALGLKRTDVEALPQCMWVPWFDDARVALGWAYTIERSTLAHATLFRHVASSLPGEAAFAASYLKCYAGEIAERWSDFGARLDASISGPQDLENIVEAAKAGFRNFRWWRNTFDGKARSSPNEPMT
ncbi:MAG: biliverdin-producing heme oxygenase [Deltaproteobacteria bacterium]|nr:biliverdin-producing heme oxygenase [Deltaproteobacteria bacterium]MDQ3300189.1 biliverdin-producing heme oxygenase [Myxococcota bacterium]